MNLTQRVERIEQLLSTVGLIPPDGIQMPPTVMLPGPDGKPRVLMGVYADGATDIRNSHALQDA